MCRAVTLLAILTMTLAAPIAPPRSVPAVPAAPRAGPSRATTKIIEYRGLRLAVPAGWPVYRLDREPNRCVRFDRHAVYLGRPGPEPDCPARLAGRTEAMHLEPLEPRSGRAPVLPAGSAWPGEAVPGPWGRRPTLALPPGYVLPGGVRREVRLPLHDAGVTITATYGSGRDVVERALQASGPATWSPAVMVAGVRTSGTWPEVATRPRAAKRRAWTTGRGFDACTAPSLRAMWAWRRTYRIANIYMGGSARGCAQPNLTRSWVRSVRRMGYRLIPTYVGLQAPCNKRYQHGFSIRRPRLEGRLSADDAVRRARTLGLRRRAPIYFDMEAYNSRRTRCRQAVLRFLHGWSRRLYQRHYRPGVYSSVASGIRDLGLAEGIARPSAVWIAHWDGKASVYGSPYIPDSWWAPHRRIKQYRGGHKERHGGVTINIDSNIIDGPVD
jgi:hypothetical protein